MPGWADRRGERLARAFDRALDSASSGQDTDENSAEPPDQQLRRELAVVRSLVMAGDLARPDAAERDRMRARIVAGLARTDSAGVGSVAGRQAASGARGRLVVAAAALCLLVALPALTLVLARDALPGDALYGVKRGTESARLDLTFGAESRGFQHLRFATARMDEIEAMTVDPGDPADHVVTLRDFDVDAAAGSRVLLEVAAARAQTGGDDLLVTLGGWAAHQHQRLALLRATLPEGVVSAADASLDLLARVAARVPALRARLACTEVTSDTSDELGRRPASGNCLRASGGPAVPPAATTAPDVLPVPVPSPHPPEVRVPGTAGTVPAPQLPTGAVVPSPGRTITVPLPLPPTTVVPPLLPGLPGLVVG